MKWYVFCTRDKKLSAFNPPLFRREDVEHMIELYTRSCMLVDEKDRSRVADEALYHLGIFDDVSGKFDFLDSPEKLADGEDYVPKKGE